MQLAALLSAFILLPSLALAQVPSYGSAGWAEDWITAIDSGGSPASEGTAGVLEIATQAETDAGTNDATCVTPEKLANTSLFGDVTSGTTDPDVAPLACALGDIYVETDVPQVCFCIDAGTDNWACAALTD